MSQLERILYVEDEPDIQAVAELALQSLGGFTLHVCSSGQQALEEAEAFKPQLILLDVMMPGMDGPTTMQELRKIDSLANVPVIFMTAKVQTNEVAEYMNMGALDVIAKPFDPMTLSDVVREIWSKA